MGHATGQGNKVRFLFSFSGLRLYFDYGFRISQAQNARLGWEVWGEGSFTSQQGRCVGMQLGVLCRACFDPVWSQGRGCSRRARKGSKERILEQHPYPSPPPDTHTLQGQLMSLNSESEEFLKSLVSRMFTGKQACSYSVERAFGNHGKLSHEEESFFFKFSIQGHKHLVWANK